MAIADFPAVREFGVESPYEVRNLKTHISRRISELTSNLTLSKDWPDHRYRVGHIRGLMDALELLEDKTEKK